MTSKELRKIFLDFFSAQGGPAVGGKHVVVPSSSLLPDDPSVLLTTAGVQQFKPYYIGEADPIKDFNSKNTASIQKSFRTSDIDEVGDESHLTFFEMLGNFSFGGYFKKEAITYAYEFITKELNLPISYVTIFKGSDDVPKDEESCEIWKTLGVVDIREEGMDDVFWGPTGNSGPCGPTTEIYCRSASGKDIEIWNIVFNEYFFSGSREELNSGTSGKKLEKLKTPGVDTGMGFERLAMIVQNKRNIFETDLFQNPFGYFLLFGEEGRIISDHLRGSMFLIADGVRPSNKDAGYILRRLIRRAAVICKIKNIPLNSLSERIEGAINFYDFYPELMSNKEDILNVIQGEINKFDKALEKGLKEFFKKYPEMNVQEVKSGENREYQYYALKKVSVEDAFYFHQTFGLTIDIIKDLAKRGGHFVDEDAFNKEFKKHQEVSRRGQEKKFGGHGLILDTGELKAVNAEEAIKVTRLHTATHLLQAALRRVFKEEIKQLGSDINTDRLRFDFSFSRKMTADEIKNVENIVNGVIENDYSVIMEEMAYEDAIKKGALAFFKEKYPSRVFVYTIKNKKGEPYSQELCGGPHVKQTSEIGKFKIIKEEAVGSGARRIRAIVES